MPLPALIEAMLQPSFYRHAPEDVVLVQTHISYVLLAGTEVYKIKKPVRFSFLDFSTLALRRHFCHEEVRLNRRLAPGVYLGVRTVCRDGKGYRLGEEEDRDVVEYVVHMRRLPAEKMLDRLLEQQQVPPGIVEALVDRIVAFHRAADCGPEVVSGGTPEAVRAVLEDNFQGVREFHERTVSAHDDAAIQAFAADFLEKQRSLFERRCRELRIRDCHGDLRAEHVCCVERPLIFDCIEFNPVFRHCDVAAEIAFLAMDFDCYGRADLSAELEDRYAAATGDGDLPLLLPFYKCYRAYVRGKVESMKSAEPEVGSSDRERAMTGARRHFLLAYRYTWAYTPALIVVLGLSGTGKSSVAARLAQRTGFRHVNSDTVRKRLAGLPAHAPARAAYDTGLYSPEQSERTYGAMLATAEEELRGGRGIVLDATFQRRAHREETRKLAERLGVPHLFVECRATDDEVRRRLAARAAGSATESDADWNVYQEQKKRFEPLEDAERTVAIDTESGAECGTEPIEDRVRHMARPSRSGTVVSEKRR